MLYYFGRTICIPSNDFFARKDLPLVFGNLPVFDIDVGINDSQWSERDPNAPLDELGKAGILAPNFELTGKVMNIDFIDEPDLEFGGGGHHIDVRFGIMQHGPLDRGAPTSPAQLRVGNSRHRRNDRRSSEVVRENALRYSC